MRVEPETHVTRRFVHRAAGAAMAESSPAAVHAGDLFFSGPVSGQHGEGTARPTAAVIEAAFANVRTLLESSGVELAQVGHVFIWLADFAHLAAVDKAWAATFPNPEDCPARHTVLRSLRGGAPIWIEVIAVTKGTRKTSVSRTNRQDGRAIVPLAASIGRYLFCSGVAGRDAAGALPEDPADQVPRMWDNMASIVEESGFTLADVAHCFVWQRDHQYRTLNNPPWERLFPDPASRPARHALEGWLPDNMVTSLDVIAVRGSVRRSMTEIPGFAHRGGSGRGGMLPVCTTIGDVLFSSATPGTDANGETPADAAGEITYAIANTKALLTANGFALEDVVHAYAWTRDIPDRSVLDTEWTAAFPDPQRRPVRHDFETALPRSRRIQLEIVALRDRAGSEVPGTR